MIKRNIYILVLIICFIKTNAQCDCNTITDENNNKQIQCNPKPIGGDNSSQLGIAAASNGVDNFIQIAIRFKAKSKKVSSSLTIILNNNNKVTLSLVNTQIAQIGNSELSNAIFSLTNTQYLKLKESEIKTVSVTLSDNITRTYKADMNSNVLINQLNCF